jgi:hypothetical protein
VEQWRRENNGAPIRRVRIIDEYAVLVGHFKDLDAASSAAKRIKELKSPSSIPLSRPMIARVSGVLGKGTRANDPIFKRVGNEGVNPFAQAFPVRNPLLPRDPAEDMGFEKPGTEEELLLQMNQREKYSLLQNRQPWTLVVKLYQGASAIQPESKPSIFDKVRPWGATRVEAVGPKGGIDLNKAALEASQLAELLRSPAYGLDAYVFHTDTASFVTVGGFQAHNDADLMKLQRQLNGLKAGEFQLMSPGVPMKVPGR